MVRNLARVLSIASIALGTLGPSSSNQTCTGVPGAYGKYSGNDDGTAPNTTWMIAPYPLAKPANRR